MIRVTVFNEFFHEKTDEKVKSIYPGGIHKALKENLSDSEITVKTVTLDDPECGLTDEVLKNTDVLIWWGHMHHDKVPDDEITLDMYETGRPSSDVHDFYRNFCAVLDKKAEPAIKHSEVRRVMQVMEAAFSSAEQKQRIKVEI